MSDKRVYDGVNVIHIKVFFYTFLYPISRTQWVSFSYKCPPTPSCLQNTNLKKMHHVGYNPPCHPTQYREMSVFISTNAESKKNQQLWPPGILLRPDFITISV